MSNPATAATGETPAPSIRTLRVLHGRVALREDSIKNLKSGLKDARKYCSAALTSLLQHLDRAYGGRDAKTLSEEDHNAASTRARDIFLQKKEADDALKNLQDQIEEEETKRTQDLLTFKSGEAALQRVPVVAVSVVGDVEFVWQRKIECRRLELVRGKDPGEVVAIRQFCESHSLDITDAQP